MTEQEKSHCLKCEKELTWNMSHPKVEEFVSQHGMCRQCLIESKGLIKDGNHYVMWDYRYAYDTGQIMDKEYYSDVYAQLPKITRCEKHGKLKMEFVSADIGGYDAGNLVWYYDSIEDILKDMGIDKL